MLRKPYSLNGAQVSLRISNDRRKQFLQLGRPGLVLQHLGIQPIELNERDVVQQGTDTVLLAPSRDPIEDGWSEAYESLFGVSASIFKEPEPASNRRFIVGHWLDAE
jgi:hypothetical protein